MASNRAAFQPSKKAPRLEVSDAPYPKPGERQIVVRNAAVAINPIDWLIQDRGDLAFTHLKYPIPLGFDIAGEVVEVGKGSRFNTGDHVVGLCRGTEASVNDPAEGGFQNFVVMRDDFTSTVPSTMAFTDAAVIPLSLSTAGNALFDKTQLGLQLPTHPPREPTGKTVVIWGGSTSIGSSAIQMAIAAGYEVFSTSSPKNFEKIQKLGASRVFDYRSKNVDTEIIAALKGKVVAGAVAIGEGSAEHCMSILHKSHGHKFVALVSFPVSQKEPPNLVFLRTISYMLWWIATYKLRGSIYGVKSAFTFIKEETCRVLFTDYLPSALAAGSFVPAPEAEIAGHGLEAIQGAFELQKKGVSAKKIVVTL